MRNTSIAENIAAGRRELGITQAALAERVGVTKAAVSKWELGQSLPDVAMLPRLASQLGVTLDELIGYGQELSDEEVSTIICRDRIRDVFGLVVHDDGEQVVAVGEAVASRLVDEDAEFSHCSPG